MIIRGISTALPPASIAGARWHGIAQAIGTACVIAWSLSGKCDDKEDPTLDNLLKNVGIDYEFYAAWIVILSVASILGESFVTVEKDSLPDSLLRVFGSSAAVGRVVLVLFGCALATTVHYNSYHNPLATQLGVRIPVGMFSGTCIRHVCTCSWLCARAHAACVCVCRAFFRGSCATCACSGCEKHAPNPPPPPPPPEKIHKSKETSYYVHCDVQYTAIHHDARLLVLQGPATTLSRVGHIM